MTTPASNIDAIVRALGPELSELREGRGLSREHAVELLAEMVGLSISWRTLLSYEHSTRGLTVRRLLELAATYEKPATTILADAIRRAGQDPSCPLCGHH